MQLLNLLVLFQTALAAAKPSHSGNSVHAPRQNEDRPTPTRWGIVTFPGFDLLDVYGPLEILYFVAMNQHLEITLITPEDAPLNQTLPMSNPYNSTFPFPGISSTADFSSSPEELNLDVLFVPGGIGTRDPANANVDDFLLKIAPETEYLFTVCTGALFAARAGLLEGKRATTNKKAWDTVTAEGTEDITWVAPARYVVDVDGKTWSSSGVSAGIDMMFAFVKEFYGEELHDKISLLTEVVPRSAGDDPFTDMLGIPHQGQELSN